jgi:small GTP-binding protein
MYTREVPLPDGTNTLSLQLWDTAGQEQFHALTSSYFRQAHAVILAYDVHSPSSFASLQRWVDEVDRHAPAEVVKLVIGTKCDGGGGGVVSEEEAQAFASKHGALCQRCSAKDGNGVFALFEALAAKVVRNGFNPDGRLSIGRKQGQAKKKKGGCC